MSPRDEERSEPGDRVLDELVRASRSRRDFVRPADEDLWAWVTGTATERQRQIVSDALLVSPEFRREVLEICSDGHEIVTRETQQRFDEEGPPFVPTLEELFARRQNSHAPEVSANAHRETPAGSSDRVSHSGRRAEPISMRGFIRASLRLARVPVFAYGFMLLLMAYPTFRWLALEMARAPRAHDGDSTPVVIPSQTLFLRAWAGELRGGGEALKIPELSLQDPPEIVDLIVWVPSSFHLVEGARYAATLSSDREILWREDDFRGRTAIDGQTAFRLLVNPARLQSGTFTLRVEQTSPARFGGRAIEARFLAAGD